MKKTLTLVPVLLLILGVTLAAPASAAVTGASDWAKADIESGIASGLISAGLQANYKQNVNRANVSELVVNLLEKASGKSVDAIMKDKGAKIGSFGDTTDKNVLSCNALGIINGTENGKFSPAGNLTRAQFAAIISRVAGVLDYELGGYAAVTFSDVQNHWVKSELPFSVAAGLFNGVGNNKFNPDAPLTVEQLDVVAVRVLAYFNAGSDTPSDAAYFPYSFTAEDLYGNTVTEKTLGDKDIYFVHYWATWCGPCVNEMPDLANVAKKYGDRVGFIALLDDYSSSLKSAIDITEGAGVSFLMVDANDGDFKDLLKMVKSGYVPTTVLIDKDGNMIGDQIIGSYGSGYGAFIDYALKSN